MNVTGIIAEYNPFHLGHAYHLAEARRLTNADYLIVIMSGDFVQRGEPAIFNKYVRTQMALMDGADLVLELPVPFATASSEDFAGGAVAILDKLGVINHLSFGSEAGCLSDLLSVAELLENESAETSELIRLGLKDGLSYPAAVSKALLSAPQGSSFSQKTTGTDENSSALSAILSTPNNLLGVEYCRALKHRSSSIQPVTIKRLGDYHGADISASSGEQVGFPSASALRKVFMAHDMAETAEMIRASVPENTLSLMKKEVGYSGPLFADDFTDALFYRLLNETGDCLCKHMDVTPDLAGRIMNLMSSCRTYTELAETVKCRSYTRLRINRALLHTLLGITDKAMSAFKANDYANYARVLGFKDSAKPLLREISEHASIPLLLRMKEDRERLSATDLTLLRMNDFASDLYRMTAQRKYGNVLADEYSRRLLRL
ncbi:MAG: nucleotidyltransferase family protein [Lachnospiraceae bacterium]|nr:nucleotidyltransferase family protein [Lachnospiraceae bacterium]